MNSLIHDADEMMRNSLRDLTLHLSRPAGFFDFSGGHGWLWSCAPMELCCREGPDGGTGPRGKNPRKWFAVPRPRGLPLNGCMPRVAWQQLGATASSSSRRRRSTGGCANGRRRRARPRPAPAAAAWKQPPAMDSGQYVELFDFLPPLTLWPPASMAEKGARSSEGGGWRASCTCAVGATGEEAEEGGGDIWMEEDREEGSLLD